MSAYRSHVCSVSVLAFGEAVASPDRVVDEQKRMVVKPCEWIPWNNLYYLIHLFLRLDKNIV